MTEVCYLAPEGHYARPHLLTEAIQRCGRLTKSIILLEKIGQVSEKQLRNIISVAQAFLHYTDLASLQYGMLDRVKNMFKRFDLKLVKRMTGLSDSSLYKAIKSLKKAGFIFVKPLWKKVLPGYFYKSHPNYRKAFKAKPAIRQLTPSFFAILGISKESLERAQSEAMRKQEQRVRKGDYREKRQKSSLWAKMPFFKSLTFSTIERNNKTKAAIKHLFNIKSILRRSFQSLGP